MESAIFWLRILGFVIITYYLIRNVKRAMVYGIVFTAKISWWSQGTKVTTFLDIDDQNKSYSYFNKVVDVHKIQSTICALSFSDFHHEKLWVALIKFLYVDLLDTIGILYSMAKFIGFTDDKGNFEGQYFAFMSDAFAIMVGTLLGTTPVMKFIKYLMGIQEGGQIRMKTLIISIYFLLAFLFTPLLESISP
eukprot:Gb_21954 [translate_table: standard]